MACRLDGYVVVKGRIGDALRKSSNLDFLFNYLIYFPAIWENSSCLLVEIRRRHRIGREVMDELQAKISRLKVSSGLSLRTALVYAGELDAVVTAEHAFDFVVPFSDLLKVT